MTDLAHADRVEGRPAPPSRTRPWVGVWARAIATGGRGLQLLWRLRLGWMAGNRFLVVTHLGRRTGRPYRTVRYVQRYDPRTREATVISVLGESQWVRNLRHGPARQVEIALQRYAPDHRFLGTEEIFELEKAVPPGAPDRRMGPSHAHELAVAGYRPGAP